MDRRILFGFTLSIAGRNGKSRDSIPAFYIPQNLFYVVFLLSSFFSGGMSISAGSLNISLPSSTQIAKLAYPASLSITASRPATTDRTRNQILNFAVVRYAILYFFRGKYDGSTSLTNTSNTRFKNFPLFELFHKDISKSGSVNVKLKNYKSRIYLLPTPPNQHNPLLTTIAVPVTSSMGYWCSLASAR